MRDDTGEVIGSLSVGILESRIDEDYAQALNELLPWAIGALLAGTLASSGIAALWERRFRRLDEAARESAELRRTAAALREQSHEFHTRLHVIHGLVSHGDTSTALSYIGGIAPVATGQEEESLPDQPLLRATVDVLRAELGAHGARLETELRVVSVVDEEVTLVLANLCRNAGEAGASVVRCVLTEHDGRFFGEVSDNGTGVAEGEAERVFTRGVSSKRDASGFGRGIGLELVRRTVADRGAPSSWARRNSAALVSASRCGCSGDRGDWNPRPRGG